MVRINYTVLGEERTETMSIERVKRLINDWSNSDLCSVKVHGNPEDYDRLFVIELLHENDGSFGIFDLITENESEDPEEDERTQLCLLFGK